MRVRGALGKTGRKIFMKIHSYLLIAVIISLSAQGQSLYRVVQGKIVPRNSPDWTVIHDAIEVTGYIGGALRCAHLLKARLTTAEPYGAFGLPCIFKIYRLKEPTRTLLS
jgi:hypothetical protein